MHQAFHQQLDLKEQHSLSGIEIECAIFDLCIRSASNQPMDQ